VHKGRVVFGAMDEVVFGRPASEAIQEQLDRLGAQRAFLMVSGTLNRETDEVGKIRRVLGPRWAGTFDAMPPHTPRAAVIAAAEQARAAGADVIVTIGGGSITDGAKAVQLCLANDIRDPDDIDRIRTGRGAPPQLKAPTVRQSRVRSSSIPGSACTRRNGCGSRPVSAPSTIASKASVRARRSPMATPRHCRGCRCWRAHCRG